MTDITELAQSLKAAADKASNADWVKESGDGWEAICSNDDQVNGGFIIAHFEGPDAAENREFVQAANPANILALVEALEKAQQQTTESENRVRKQNRHICELFDDNTALRQRIAELEESHAQVIQCRDHYKRISEEGLKKLAESRTVTVKLPADRAAESEVSGYDGTEFYRAGWNARGKADKDALTAQGIKWEAE
ncbi:ead/Ea22-like family protein [Klebsiella aerogenes]|uniref:ead/Ea22-like family protein n=1 Tax=Klebsiella aerogenes TaxID=548 RepID=UPI0028A55339|nr:ead/Ea22-like family protein [Klebsiella aerogenes]MDT4321846.1 ead/Ea22-like family protein [Klebsiella aerogenes]